MTDLSQLSDAELTALYKRTADPFGAALEAEGATGTIADVARSIYQQESGSGRNTKTSNAGAVGGMQIKPSTFREVADEGWDVQDPHDNARAGIRYIKRMNEMAGGDPALTAAGYYGGPGGLEKARRGVAVSDPRNPNAPNTLQYGQQVVARLPNKPKNPIMRGVEALTDAVIPKASAAEAPPTDPLASMSDDELRAAYAAALAEEGGAVAAPALPSRSPVQRLAHGVGVGARGIAKGLVEIPGMVTDAVTGPINAGLDAVRGEGNGFRFQRAGAAADNLMTAAGVPVAENATERVLQDVNRGGAGAAGMVGTGAVMATKAGGALTRALGQILAAGPRTQVIGGATSGAAAGAVRENGGGEGAQILAALAGGVAPAAVPYAAKAAIRGAMRGGEIGRQRVADNIAAFQGASGEMPTVGQATGNRTLQAMETGLSNVVGGAGVMVRKGERQAEALSHSVQDLTEALAPNASGADAGEAISRGVSAFRDNVKVTQRRLYDQLDRFIAPDAPITVSNTRAAMQDLNEGIDGAENLSKWFRNAKLSDLEKSLVADLEAAAAKQAPAGSQSSVMNAPPLNLDTAALPYESIKKMRTLVGREMGDANFTSEISRDKWSRLYAALSEDLGATAKAAGPQAEQAWSRANTYTRLASERMEQLSSIVNRDAPEKIFRAATSGLADGGTQITRLMKSMPMENRREVTAAVLQRLGRATPGQQNEMGDAFSSETFLTNLAKLSPAARSALFEHSGFPRLQERVAQMGRMAANRREGSKVFANPSGTARQTALLGWFGTLLTGIATGNAATIGGALAVPIAAAGAARMAVNPALVRGLAEKTVLNPGAPAAILAGSMEAMNARTPTPTDQFTHMSDDQLKAAYAEALAAEGGGTPSDPGQSPVAAPELPAQINASLPIDPAAPRIELRGMAAPLDDTTSDDEDQTDENTSSQTLPDAGGEEVSGAGGAQLSPSSAVAGGTGDPGGVASGMSGPAAPESVAIAAAPTAEPVAANDSGFGDVPGVAAASSRPGGDNARGSVAVELGGAGAPARAAVPRAPVDGGVQSAVLPPANRADVALTPIAAAAHEAATSPHNDLPEPTEAQKEAGNYKKGHVRVHGLGITVESPQGSERNGTRPDGSTWSHAMSDHYGYIRRTEGADDEQVDVYVGPKPESKRVFVVDQLDQRSGKFDEHKVMLGFPSQPVAMRAYRSNFDKGWKVGNVTEMSVDAFKNWLAEGDLKKPVSRRRLA